MPMCVCVRGSFASHGTVRVAKVGGSMWQAFKLIFEQKKEMKRQLVFASITEPAEFTAAFRRHKAARMNGNKYM